MGLKYNIFATIWKLVKNIFYYGLACICGGVEVIWFYIRQRFLGNRLPNYFVVEDETLHRGGQPSARGLQDLTKSGIKTIINLRLGKFSQKVIDAYANDQIRVFHLPFSPFEPADHIMINFLKILLNPSHTPAFVHCFHGADRTGAVCAIYRIIVQNWDKERAIAEMRKKGLHWWHTNMIDYINNIDVPSLRKLLEIHI